jgi:hypothetical protein
VSPLSHLDALDKSANITEFRANMRAMLLSGGVPGVAALKKPGDLDSGMVRFNGFGQVSEVAARVFTQPNLEKNGVVRTGFEVGLGMFFQVPKSRDTEEPRTVTFIQINPPSASQNSFVRRAAAVAAEQRITQQHDSLLVTSPRETAKRSNASVAEELQASPKRPALDLLAAAASSVQKEDEALETAAPLQSANISTAPMTEIQQQRFEKILKEVHRFRNTTMADIARFWRNNRWDLELRLNETFSRFSGPRELLSSLNEVGFRLSRQEGHYLFYTHEKLLGESPFISVLDRPTAEESNSPEEYDAFRKELNQRVNSNSDAFSNHRPYFRFDKDFGSGVKLAGLRVSNDLSKFPELEQMMTDERLTRAGFILLHKTAQESLFVHEYCRVGDFTRNPPLEKPSEQRQEQMTEDQSASPNRGAASRPNPSANHAGSNEIRQLSSPSTSTRNPSPPRLLSPGKAKLVELERALAAAKEGLKQDEANLAEAESDLQKATELKALLAQIEAQREAARSRTAKIAADLE